MNNLNLALTDYLTTQGLKGVFSMFGVVEKVDREKAGLRASTLLNQVFTL